MLKECRLKINYVKCEKNYNKKSCENKNYNCILEKNCLKVGNIWERVCLLMFSLIVWVFILGLMSI